MKVEQSTHVVGWENNNKITLVEKTYQYDQGNNVTVVEKRSQEFTIYDSNGKENHGPNLGQNIDKLI